MKSKYKRLGDYIREFNIKNSDNKIDNRLSVRAITFTFTRDTETDLMRWYGRSRYEALGIPTHTHDFNYDKGIDEIFGE
jgi:hypothetical protein